MKNFQYKWHLGLMLVVSMQSLTLAAPTAEAEPRLKDEPKLVVISEDVISDFDNTTQKVIRVNPLDLPAVNDKTNDSIDSSLYKIQNLLPARRKYVNSNRMRRPQPVVGADSSTDSPILRSFPETKILKPKQQQKKKKLNFLYNQADADGNLLAKQMKVHVAPGAYPVYYTVSKTNGKFGKFPIKSFHNLAQFKKYLAKSKQEPISLMDRYDYSS